MSVAVFTVESLSTRLAEEPMTTLFNLGIACMLIVAVAFTACAPPTPKVERPGSSSAHEQRSPNSMADFEGSVER